MTYTKGTVIALGGSVLKLQVAACIETVYTKMTEANAFKNKKNKLYTVAS